MLFSEIIGLEHLKRHLTTTADRGRVPHAQLFAGAHGSGTLPMAIAYAQYILCQNQEGENSGPNQKCNLQVQKLSHPDLHFAVPVAKARENQKHPITNDFIVEWREFIKNKPYGSLFDWYSELKIENKQGKIGVDEAQDIGKALNLKSYQGGFKVMIIWGAEKMNQQAANKLLKLIEEPPKDSLLILITENEEQLLQTIRSRCQVLHFPPLGQKDILAALQEKHSELNENEAQKIAHQANGDFSRALQLLGDDENERQFEEWFIEWVRTAFQAKGNKAAIRSLITWGNKIAKENRETQKKFLNFCLSFFRQALLKNYKAEELVYYEPKSAGFKLENFAPFIHGNNILEIQQELEESIFHVERNANPKILFTDLSIKLTRLIHRKAA
jgi:DNA polymerase-3 subunit delta'